MKTKLTDSEKENFITMINCHYFFGSEESKTCICINPFVHFPYCVYFKTFTEE